MTNIVHFTNPCTTDHGQKMIVCSCCGRRIPSYPDADARDYLEITKNWGYFSRKDGEIHHFYICEDCYDAWLKTFAGKVEVTENTELL